MKKKLFKNISKILLVINTSFFILSLSIAVPILYRPFYYSEIKTLKIEEKTGYSYEDIKEAYDDVIDYTTSLNKKYKTGKLKYTEEGKSHFRDCKILFMFDFLILGISGVIIVIKKIFFNNIKIKNYNISFWSSILLLFSFLSIVIGYLILGFDRSFSLFHKIMFLGKTNWILDIDTDEVVNILPNEFFIHCAILVISLISIISISIVVKELIIKKKNKKNML